MPLIEVTVASSESDLTTTGRVRTALGLTSSQTSDDSAIATAIRAATRWAESYVGYPLFAAKYRESLPSYGTRSLKLARAPVRAVTLLMNGTDTGEGTEVDSTSYVVNVNAGLLQRPTGWAWSVPMEQFLDARPLVGQEFPDWVCDYVAGYTYGGIDTGSSLWSTEKGTTSTGRTLPEDIELAVVQKSVGMFRQDENVASESVGDLSVSYRTASSGDRQESIAEQLLARYVRTA